MDPVSQLFPFASIVSMVLAQCADWIVKRHPKWPDIIRPFAAYAVNTLSHLIGIQVISVAHAQTAGAVPAPPAWWVALLMPLVQNAMIHYLAKWGGVGAQTVAAARQGGPLPGTALYQAPPRFKPVAEE